MAAATFSALCSFASLLSFRFALALLLLPRSLAPAAPAVGTAGSGLVRMTTLPLPLSLPTAPAGDTGVIGRGLGTGGGLGGISFGVWYGCGECVAEWLEWALLERERMLPAAPPPPPPPRMTKATDVLSLDEPLEPYDSGDGLGDTRAPVETVSAGAERVSSGCVGERMPAGGGGLG